MKTKKKLENLDIDAINQDIDEKNEDIDLENSDIEDGFDEESEYKLSKPRKKGKKEFRVLSFLFPVVGLILFFAFLKKSASAAKNYLICGLSGLLVYAVLVGVVIGFCTYAFKTPVIDTPKKEVIATDDLLKTATVKGVGETFNANNLTVSIVDVDEDWKGYNEGYEPANNKKYIKVTVSIENATENYILPSTLSVFVGKKEYKNEYISSSEINFLGFSGIASGEKRLGSVIFTVPQKTEGFDILYASQTNPVKVVIE